MKQTFAGQFRQATRRPGVLSLIVDVFAAHIKGGDVYLCVFRVSTIPRRSVVRELFVTATVSRLNSPVIGFGTHF